MSRFKELYERLNSISDLPSFPTIAFEVFQIVRDPDGSATKMEKVIQKDPSIVSQVLKMANSPFYGLAGKVTSLKHAINLLGFVQISNIVMFYVTLNTIRKMPTHKYFDKDKFLEHSFGCGVTAKIISNMLNLELEGVEFTGGVIHDIGKVVVSIYEPEALDDVLKEAADKEQSLYDTERDRFGITHCELGARLLEIWGLPGQLVDVVRSHHKPLEADNVLVSSIVHVADLLTYSEGIGFGGNYAKFSLEDDEGWDVILKESKRKDLDLALFTFQLYDNIDKAKKLYFVQG